MALFAKDRLTARDVAKILFATASPSSSQVREIQMLFASGRLKGDCTSVAPTAEVSKKPWTTTSVNVAQYMASQSYRKQLASHGAKLAAVESDLRHSYRDLLTDYFQAVVLRRQSKSRSNHAWFKRSVIAGQMMLITIVITAAVLSVGLFRPSILPEHAAIEHWISQQVDRYQIICWHPARDTVEDLAVAIRVEYRYSLNNRRGVKTDRTFLVRDNKILSIDFSENAAD